jgi:hypothetical protein
MSIDLQRVRQANRQVGSHRGIPGKAIRSRDVCVRARSILTWLFLAGTRHRQIEAGRDWDRKGVLVYAIFMPAHFRKEAEYIGISEL